MSQSTLKVTVVPTLARGPSPTTEIRHRLQVPKIRGTGSSSKTEENNRSIWGEEEVELIKTCAILSSSLGLSKSLSTSDICMNDSNKQLRPWVSEESINDSFEKFDGVFPQKLEPMSRSCSTWVAVGDVVSTSQLPSPQARLGGSDSPAITAVDFIQSVNKKLRQNYIRRRLHMSYRVLKRISDHCHTQERTTLKPELSLLAPHPSSSCAPKEVLNMMRREVELPPSCPAPSLNPSSYTSLTARDVRMDKGRQLTRYERNMIIFNWLQTLEAGEEVAYV